MLKSHHHAVIIATAAIAVPAMTKVEGDTIILGAVLSETGKYSTNGIHTKNGYNIAVDLINKRELPLKFDNDIRPPFIR